jgi:hypothetical protein
MISLGLKNDFLRWRLYQLLGYIALTLNIAQKLIKPPAGKECELRPEYWDGFII